MPASVGVERISAATARRMALAAQGFADPRPGGRVDRRHVARLVDRVGVVQIDSVNVVARAHELAVFSRLGVHARNALVAAAWRGEVFEYWGHEASFLPVARQPLFRHKMAAAAQDGRAWGRLVDLARTRPQLVEDVWAEVAERGPLTAGELSLADLVGRKGPWWGWGEAKLVLEWLFWCGRLAGRRRANFEREYALVESVIPAAVLAQPTPPADEQRRELLALAARSLGVGTARDLADYYRLNLVRARPLLEELVEDRRLEVAQVEGWAQLAYVWPGCRRPRRVRAVALLSPFDSLVWERSRAERLFGFRYRLELYTPAPKRQFGYYVMPFLLGEELVGRVDLKADRAASCLRVLGAFAEVGSSRCLAEVAEALADELRTLATFVGVADVAVAELARGDLSPSLHSALSSARGA